MRGLGKNASRFRRPEVCLGLILLSREICQGRIPWLGRLPGDIHIQRGSWSLYFPLATCLVISVVLTLLFSLSAGADARAPRLLALGPMLAVILGAGPVLARATPGRHRRRAQTVEVGGGP